MKPTSLKGKVYISDAGLGPIVRQSAVVEAIRRLGFNVELSLQTDRHYDEAQRVLPSAKCIRRFNNIQWQRSEQGTPDFVAINQFYSDYGKRCQSFIDEELSDFNYDFILSDFVHEAFEVARLRNARSFGIAHFTWDWFFSNLDVPVDREVTEQMFRFAQAAEQIYFPPFTPPEILKHYTGKFTEVPFIVRKQRTPEITAQKSRFNVLLMESGSHVLGDFLQNLLNQADKMPEIQFYVSSRHKATSDNVTLLPANHLFVDYIAYMDLVVARAGFNTISECIAHRTPMLLTAEALNPEMINNVKQVENLNLAHFIMRDTLLKDFRSYLTDFLEKKYPNILKQMKAHDFRTDGADVIAKDIISRMETTK